jgi:iron(II)-dependent oxidoreductase
MMLSSITNAWVNRWRSGDKTIYTILNMKSSGLRTGLFRIEKEQGRHYVSLWRHEDIVPAEAGDSLYLTAVADGWDPANSGTRLEGSVDCIASFPELIKAGILGDSLEVSIPGSGQLLLWKGDPSVKTQRFELKFKGDTTLRLKNIIGYFEGKLVLQYLENNRLKDERTVNVKGGTPWLISSVNRTKTEVSIPSDMVLVPKSTITYKLTTREDFIPYPVINKPVTAVVDSFLIDKFPVTNSQFLEFLNSSGYKPADTAGFLRHWDKGAIRQGQEKYPVVNVAWEDINAYAKWAGKRLPTEVEWQLAAQGTDGRTWPWGNEFHGTWCNNSFDRATPVDAFSKGISPYGVFDMVGNVWQVTNDQYFNGTNYLVVIRGGSFYRPESSWWYIQGGPQPLDRTQIMLMVSPGFDRTSTVGFRCAKDVVPGSITIKDKKQK